MATPGLAVPACVRDYTDEYRAENDPLRDWLTDCCNTQDEDAWTAVADLRASYEKWCDENGEKPLDNKKFGRLLEGKGYHTKRNKQARGRGGIRFT